MRTKILALVLGFSLLTTPKISFAVSPSGDAAQGCLGALVAGLAVEGNAPIEGALGGGAINFSGPLGAILSAFGCTNVNISQGFASLLQAQQHIATTEVQATAAATTGIVAGIQTTKNNLHLGAQNLQHGACDTVYVANNMAAAGTQAANEAYYLNSKAEAYDNSVPATGMVLNAQLMQTPATLTPMALFGADDLTAGSTLQNISTGQQFIVNATNPIPLPPVPANELGGPQGTNKLAEYNLQHADVATAQKVMNDLLALRAPVANLSAWQQGVLSGLGLQTLNVGFNPMNTTTNNANQAVSLEAIIETSVEQRFSDPGYFSAVSRENATNATRILAANQAIELELLKQIWIQLQNQSAIQAELLGRVANHGRFGH